MISEEKQPLQPYHTTLLRYTNSPHLTSHIIPLSGILKKMLCHRGRYLKQIFFSPTCWDKICAGTLKEILPLCRHIVQLQAENLQVGPDDVLAIFQYCRNIESLGLGWGSNYTDDQLRLVFINNPRLRSLRIVNCHNFTGNCLEDLQDNVLEKLEVQYCANFRLTEAAASKFSSSLIEFSLYSDFPSDHGVHCVMMLKSLKRMTLSLHAEELKNMDDGVIQHVRDIHSNMHLTSSCPVWIVKFHR